jgi:ABC-type sugar transport system ATPase subunit
MQFPNEGVETIYQDLALANNLDVGANIFLGREARKRRLGGLVQTLDDKFMREESRETLESLQIRFPTLTEPIQNLSGGQRQAVAIARAVYWDAKLMIMDEPTNNLGVPEQHKVLELIRTLRDRDVPVILITPILPDAFAVTDRVIVMHRGRRVAEKATAQTTAEELVQYMVGARDDMAA